MKKSNFGETLKREREMRGVSLEEVANATRISTRNLEALENERWEQLPGGIFNRGFIRSISRYLGLDEDTLVAEYVVATNDQPQLAVWADKNPPKKPSSLPYFLVATAVLLLAAGGFLLWRNWAHLKTFLPGKQDAEAAAPASSPPAAAVAAPQPSADPSSSAPPPEPEMLQLKMDAAKPTTAKIIADGQIVFEGKVEARSSRVFRAKEKFEISAGDSFALLFELNGQAVAPIGQPGQPGSATLTRKDLVKPEAPH